MNTGVIMGWLTASLGLWIAAQVLRGVRLRSVADALWAGALLFVLQWAFHWLVFVVLGIATLGIGFLLWFVTDWIASAVVILLADKLSSRFEVDGFFNALVTAFIVAATGSVLHWLW
jgi:uncharacterized membrane protein YvlD (DUF360 family)